MNMFEERFWQTDILDSSSSGKQGRYLFVLEASNATSNAGDIEKYIRMLPGIFDEFVDVGLDGFNSALHGWDGITMAAMSHTAAHDRAKLLESDICSSTAVHSFQIAPKDENLVTT